MTSVLFSFIAPASPSVGDEVTFGSAIGVSGKATMIQASPGGNVYRITFTTPFANDLYVFQANVVDVVSGNIMLTYNTNTVKRPHDIDIRLANTFRLDAIAQG